MRVNLVGLLAVVAGLLLGSAVQAEPISEPPNWTIDWEVLERLPPAQGKDEAIGVAGAFVGVHRDALIVAGGASFPEPPGESERTVHDDIWVLERNGDQKTWHTGFRLERPLAYGMSVTTPEGLLCLGGTDGQAHSAGAFLLQWDRERRQIVSRPLPALPTACAFGSATLLGDTVYVAGGMEDTSLASAMTNFWSLDLSQEGHPDRFVWHLLPSWPGPPRAGNLTIPQHDGRSDCVFVIGGGTQLGEEPEGLEFLRDVHKFSLREERRLRREGQDPAGAWQPGSPAPHSIAAAPGIAVGQSHIFTFGGDEGSLFDRAEEPRDPHPGFPGQILAYHTITDTWQQAGPLPQAVVSTTAVMWDDHIVIPSGEIRPRVPTPDVWQGRIERTRRTFGMINFTVLGLYLLGMIGVGCYFSFRNKTTEDFFRGGQRIPGWAAGLSIFATMLSSITFIAIPAQVYQTDWTFFTVNLMAIAVAPFIIYFILPFFRRIDATSAYEYLEKRFNLAARFFASVSYTLFQLGRMAIVMFLPALALAAITPFSVPQCILIIGVLSIIYCTMGGLEAVVWTDAVQALVLLGGAVIALTVVFLHTLGRLDEVWQMLGDYQKLHMIHWDFGPGSYMTPALWVLILGGIGQNLVPYASDQGIVQRYLSTKDVRSARQSIWTNAIVVLPASLLFFGVGTALFVFYSLHPARLQPGLQNDAIFPLFIAQELPVGLSGLIVAGVFAAAQSTVSTSMNSISTVVVTDFVRRFSLLRSERAYLFLARVLTFAAGAGGTALALLFATADITSLWEQFMAVLGLFGGSMCGLFMLGIFTKRTGGLAALGGAILSAATMYWVSNHTNVSVLLYASIGIAVCVVCGYVLSFLIPERAKDLAGLTIFTVR